jgi:nicotinate-nucleotide pyrophosphorylase (carboxylating)
MRDFQQIEWDETLADDCRQLVRLAVREDLERGQDWTTIALVDAEAEGSANIVARQSGVLAGLRAVEIVVEQMDARLQLATSLGEGTTVEPNTVVAVLSGPARSMLTAERLILNFIGHLSGIATLTRKYVDLVAGTKARIYDTRKTTPGWRRLEKYAVRCGGARNHRTGLFDAVLIKDNHLALGAHEQGQSHYAPAEAVARAHQFLAGLPEHITVRQAIVEVEVDSIDQLRQVLVAAPQIVLLDNMSADQLRACVALRDKLAPQVELEASGSVNLETVQSIAETGVDRISVGALTHSATWYDVGLDWE